MMPAMFFEISGITVPLWLPPLVAFVISFFTSMVGVSGAFLLLPFQMSVLGYVAPSVSATNLVFNLVAIPSGVWRYVREKRMDWRLAWVIAAGTLPGLLAGWWLRVHWLLDPRLFKLFVGLVLLARLVLRQWHHVNLLSVAVPLLSSFAVIRAVMFALRQAFAPSGWLAAFERMLALIRNKGRRLDPASGDLVVFATAGTTGAAYGRDLVFPRGTGVVGWALREGAPVVTQDLFADERVTLTPELRARIVAAGHRAVLAVPLRREDTLVGALAVGDRPEHAGLRRADLDVDLVGLELHKRVAGGHRVARLLQPARHARVHDRFAELGNDDVGWHNETARGLRLGACGSAKA